ncbi:GNAT family N-acetyltransferase [Streptomyces sp. RB110-1]|uniref:GNAT family N-acetyltransferase n=1 Tax=unclassified Streptomyces TaxID=2593676 RepID=UPI0019022C01|nr:MULTISPECIES: GNAT family N-acetyltransferase [unclassified Streptomyces]MBK0372953.1 GNAT family N-acetyltransferase [Streptomyces sp. RB110-1]MBK0390679.1 GNAT family N-acetyltransferase [Streptomyces sp. RB110-2]
MTLTEPAPEVAGQHRIELRTSVHAIDTEEWNRVVARAGGTVFHSWEWLAAFEDAPPGRFEPRHLLAYLGDELVGVCPAYVVHECPRLSYLTELARIDLDGPVLLAHSLAALDGGPLAIPGHEGVLDGLLGALERTAAADGVRTWGVANAPAGDLAGLLLRHGYATAHITTSYRCSTDVPTAADYWGFATGRLRRKLEKERRVSGRAFTVAEEPADADNLVHLLHSILRDRGTPTDVLPEAFLRAVKTRLAPYERTVTATDTGRRPVAVFAGWQFARNRSMWLAGLDTERLPRFVPYRAMAARLIESAVATDVTSIDLGRSNGVEKRKLGARPVPLYLALDTSGRAGRAALYAACHRLEQRCQGPDEQLDMIRRCC